MDVDLDELMKRANRPNVKNHGIRRLGPTNVPFNGIPSISPKVVLFELILNKVYEQIIGNHNLAFE